MTDKNEYKRITCKAIMTNLIHRSIFASVFLSWFSIAAKPVPHGHCSRPYFSIIQSVHVSPFCPSIQLFNSTNLAAVVSEKQKRRGKKKTETETREKRWQTRAPQWHRASHRTMSPFRERRVSDQNRRPLDSLTYYGLKIVKITLAYALKAKAGTINQL